MSNDNNPNLSPPPPDLDKKLQAVINALTDVFEGYAIVLTLAEPKDNGLMIYATNTDHRIAMQILMQMFEKSATSKTIFNSGMVQ